MNKTYRFNLMETSYVKPKAIRQAVLTIPEEIVFSNYMPLKEYQSYVSVCPYSKRLYSVFKNFPRAKVYKIFDYMIVDMYDVCVLDELPLEELDTLNERFRKQISDVFFRQIIYKRELTDLRYDFEQIYVIKDNITGIEQVVYGHPEIIEKLKELKKDPYLTMAIAKFREFMMFGNSLKIKLASVNFCDYLYNNPVDSITTTEIEASEYLVHLWPESQPYNYNYAVEITKSPEIKELFDNRIRELMSYL